jgi:hypothetical protein
MSIDLQRVVVVNESRAPDRAGDVSLFKTVANAERYLEPIDVQNGEYYAYLLDGRELKLFAADGKVRIEPEPTGKDHRDRIRFLLESTGEAVLAARKRRGPIESERSPSSMSVAELVEIIEFTR